MNMIDVQDKLKNLSEDQLKQEMQAPTGLAPQFLVLSEITRRKRMRDSFQNQQAQPQTTIAEEAVAAAGVPQGGLADMARAMAPKSSIAQNTGAMPQPQMPVQGMYGGGYVQKMADGGIVVRNGRRYIQQPDGTLVDEMTGRPVMTAGQDIANFFGGIRALPATVGGAFGSMSADMAGQMNEDLRAQSRALQGEAAFGMRAGPDTSYQYPPVPVPDMSSIDMVANALEGRSGFPTVDLDLTQEEGPSAYDDLMQQVWENTGPSAALGGPNVIPQAQRVEPTVNDIAPTPPAPPAPDMYPTDLSWIADMAGSAFDAITGGASGFSGVPEQFATPEGRADRDQQGGTPAAAPAQTTEEVETDAPIEPPATPPSVDLPVVLDDGGSGSAGASISSSGAASSGMAGGASSYEQELIDAMQRAEKRATQDKWLALAQVGLGLMSSKEPTLLGALGEAGMGGLGAFQQARDQYEDERLGISKTLFDIQQQRAAAAAAQRAAAARAIGKPKTLDDILKEIDSDLSNILVEVDDLATGAKTYQPRAGYEDVAAQLEAQREALLRKKYGIGSSTFDATAQ